MNAKQPDEIKKKLFEAKKGMPETIIELQKFLFADGYSNEYLDG